MRTTENLNFVFHEAIDVIKRKVTINLPDKMLEHLALLGKSPILPRLRTKCVNYNAFGGTHLGDELRMLDVVQRCKASIYEFFFFDEQPIKFEYKGDEIEISRETFDTDIQWLLLASDIGKAGTNSDNRAVVSTLFNDLLVTDEHSRWLFEHREDLPQIYCELDIPAFDFSNSDLSFAPIALVVYITCQIARSRGIEEERIARLSLNEGDINELQKLGIDYKKSTMRDLWNSHIRFGEMFFDGLVVLDSRSAALVRLSLCHHLSQGIYPRCFANGELQLTGRGADLAIFLEFVDKLDAFINRGGLDPHKSFDNVKNIFKSTTRVKNDQNQIDIRIVWERISRIDWIKLAEELSR
ncbi:MAG: hypothetical protein N2558_04510 [Patescibacteria group bacterium]|nr:hypothetical protein [Patescibacteria group bacterium]